MDDLTQEWANRALKFNNCAFEIFSAHEASGYRVLSVEKSRKQLKGLSIKQEGLLGKSLACITYKLYEPAYVMAWAAFIDFLEQKMAEDGLKKFTSIVSMNPRYKKLQGRNTVEEIRRNTNEWNMIDLAVDMGIIDGSESHILHGKLTERNLCAHPTGYKVNQNTALGYVNGLIHWIEVIRGRPL